MGRTSIEQVVQRETPKWLAIPGVAGTAVGTSGEQDCIKVYVTTDASELRDRIPEYVDGYPVVLQLTGDIRSL